MAVAENPGADRADDVVRRGIAGQNHAGIRLQGVHAAGHAQAVGTIVPLAGQNHIEGCPAQARLGIGPPISFLDGTVFPLEHAADDARGRNGRGQ